MAGIVRAPKNNTMDYDYIAFSFNNQHSYEDFGIYRVSEGNDGYKDEPFPQLNEKTAEVPGMVGKYYFGTEYKERVFNINFAFDKLDDATYAELKKWLNVKQVGPLWFAEEPYKVYMAKVTGNLTFTKNIFYENGKRVHKGKGSVQFTCYYPFARTPDVVQYWNGTTWVVNGSGKTLTSYNKFNNYNEWKTASGLTASTGSCVGEHPGEVETYFILTKGSVTANTTFKVGDYSITIPNDCSSLTWNSKTGLVTAQGSDGLDVPIYFTGNSCGTIPPGGVTSGNMRLNGATLVYDYCYY